MSDRLASSASFSDDDQSNKTTNFRKRQFHFWQRRPDKITREIETINAVKKKKNEEIMSTEKEIITAQTRDQIVLQTIYDHQHDGREDWNVPRARLHSMEHNVAKKKAEIFLMND